MYLLLKASCEFFIVWFIKLKPWGYECLLRDDAVTGETKGILSNFVTGGGFYVPVQTQIFVVSALLVLTITT